MEHKKYKEAFNNVLNAIDDELFEIENKCDNKTVTLEEVSEMIYDLRKRIY